MLIILLFISTHLTFLCSVDASVSFSEGAEILLRSQLFHLFPPFMKAMPRM